MMICWNTEIKRVMLKRESVSDMKTSILLSCVIVERAREQAVWILNVQELGAQQSLIHLVVIVGSFDLWEVRRGHSRLI